MNAPLKSALPSVVRASDATGWNPQGYGSKDDPIRPADLAQLASPYGCGKRFELRKLEEGSGTTADRKRVYGAQIISTATHEVLRRILTAASADVLAGRKPTEQRVRAALLEEMARAAGGLPIEWKKARPDVEIRAAVAMVRGAVATIPQYFRSILVVEEPFLVALDTRTSFDESSSAVWAAGTINFAGELHADGRLVNGMRLNGGLGAALWSTRSTRPNRVVLDHGFDGSIYARALTDGVLSPGTERERSAPGYPSQFFFVHLRDFVPYSKATSRRIGEEDAAWLGKEVGEMARFVAGDQRGPAWYPSRRTTRDDDRFFVSVGTITRAVREEVFVENIDDHCASCPYRDRCLNESLSDIDSLGDFQEALDAIDGSVVTGIDHAA